MKCLSYNNFFCNFANRTKLSIITALAEREMSVKEIAEKVKAEQSAISHNLRKLLACHILEVRRKGKERIYSLNKETVMPVIKLAETHVKQYCPGGCCK